MTEYIEIYGKDKKIRAAARLRKITAVYALCAFCFAAFCVSVILLFKFASFNVYAAASLNIIVTAAFCWYSVYAFTVAFPDAKAEVFFANLQDNASVRKFFGVYKGETKDVEVQGRIFTEYVFYSEESEIRLLAPEGLAAFEQNGSYALKTAGRYLLAFAEEKS